MFEDEYIDVDSEIKVRRPAPSDDASHWMRPVPVFKVDNVESHALSSTTSGARPRDSNPDQLWLDVDVRRDSSVPMVNRQLAPHCRRRYIFRILRLSQRKDLAWLTVSMKVMALVR